VRRQEEDAAEAAAAARFWFELADRWDGKGKIEREDARWARDLGASIARTGRLQLDGPYSLRTLRRLVGAQDLVAELVPVVVRHLRDAGATWEQIGGELGITGEGARKRYGGAS